MDIAAIQQLIADGKVEYVKVGAPDIEGVYRGKRVASRFFLILWLTVLHNAMCFLAGISRKMSSPIWPLVTGRAALPTSS